MMEPSITNSIRYMARGRIVDDLTTAIAQENGWDAPDDVANAREMAEQVVDLLIEDHVIVASERWDEDCHTCEQRIGDHTVDGRCPGAGYETIREGRDESQVDG